MDLCTPVSIVIVLVVLFVLGYALIRAFRPADTNPTQSRHRFKYCPSCDAALIDGDRNCPECGLDVFGKLAGRLERMRLARLEIRRRLLVE